MFAIMYWVNKYFYIKDWNQKRQEWRSEFHKTCIPNSFRNRYDNENFPSEFHTNLSPKSIHEKSDFPSTVSPTSCDWHVFGSEIGDFEDCRSYRCRDDSGKFRLLGKNVISQNPSVQQRLYYKNLLYYIKFQRHVLYI